MNTSDKVLIGNDCEMFIYSDNVNKQCVNYQSEVA